MTAGNGGRIVDMGGRREGRKQKSPIEDEKKE